MHDSPGEYEEGDVGGIETMAITNRIYKIIMKNKKEKEQKSTTETKKRVQERK